MREIATWHLGLRASCVLVSTHQYMLPFCLYFYNYYKWCMGRWGRLAVKALARHAISKFGWGKCSNRWKHMLKYPTRNSPHTWATRCAARGQPSMPCHLCNALPASQVSASNAWKNTRLFVRNQFLGAITPLMVVLWGGETRWCRFRLLVWLGSEDMRGTLNGRDLDKMLSCLIEMYNFRRRDIDSVLKLILS